MEISDKKEEEQKEEKKKKKKKKTEEDGEEGEEEQGKEEEEETRAAEPAGDQTRVQNEHGQVSLAGVIETEKTTADSQLRTPT